MPENKQPKAREAKRAARGETRGEREGQGAREGENAARAQAANLPRHLRLEPLLAFAFMGTDPGAHFFPTEHPRWFLESVASALEEPRRGRLLEALAGAAGAGMVDRLVHKLARAQVRILRCDDVSMLPAETVLLIGLQALGLSGGEAHKLTKCFTNRAELHQEDPRRRNAGLDLFLDFAAECCVFQPDGRASSKAVYAAFAAFCARKGLQAGLSRKALSAELLKCGGVSACRSTGGSHWLHGIALR